MEKKTTRPDFSLGFCQGRYMVNLHGIKEVMGHDDSLPFNTHFIVKDQGQEICTGRAWNDGWGGDTEVEFTTGQLTDEVSSYIHDNFYWEFPEFNSVCHFDLAHLITVLAEIYLGIPQLNKGQIMSEDHLKRYLKHHCLS